MALDYMRHGVDVWVKEGRITAQRAEELLTTMNAPEVERAVFHLGAHFAISLPLRFPFGAIARFFYTLTLRLRAEIKGLLTRRAPRDERRMHTWLVMLISLLPGFGRLGYFFSPALAGEKLLLLIPLDQVSRKLPLKTYRRLHLDALFVFWAGDEETGTLRRLFMPGSYLRAFEALRELRPQLRPAGIVLGINVIAFAIGAYLFLTSGQSWDSHAATGWFAERNVIASLDAFQLLAGGVFGIMAYRSFWRIDGARARDAAGIFLWGIGGIGLIIFAFDDFFGFHESTGGLLAKLQLGVEVVNNLDDLLILSYALVGICVLYMFRMELLSRRASSTLLLFAAVSAVLMVATDAFATTPELKALEFPTQTLASMMLMFAFARRFQEVRQEARAPVAVTDARRFEDLACV
jgi:hypothetical protein